MTFTGGAGFVGAAFTGGAGFFGANFNGGAGFGEATFGGDSGFDRATFRRLGDFSRARFEQARQFGPMRAHERLVLDDAQFAQPVQIEDSATGLCCRRARFPAGVQFRLRRTLVVLDDTDFPAPALLTGIPKLADTELAAREERPDADLQRRPTGWLDHGCV